MDISPEVVASLGKNGKPFQRGGLSVPVEEKIFTSEIKRLDSDIANAKKSQEKFETKIEKAVDDLRRDMREGFAKVDARIDRLDSRIDKLDSRLWWLMGAVMVSILVPIALKFLFP
jgi:polyhydroxyalkanoate synthesis regulator phasin